MQTSKQKVERGEGKCIYVYIYIYVCVCACWWKLNGAVGAVQLLLWCGSSFISFFRSSHPLCSSYFMFDLVMLQSEDIHGPHKHLFLAYVHVCMLKRSRRLLCLDDLGCRFRPFDAGKDQLVVDSVLVLNGKV